MNLLVEKFGAIEMVTLNRPAKLNALSVELFEELRDYLLAFKGRGLILTGAGDRAFAAGADIRQMSQMSVDEGERFAALAQDVTEMIERLPVPVIACVNGFALGGGCELAMSADYIFALEGASFGQPEVSLGLIPGFGGCVRLLRLVGPALAKELIFTGRPISADEALAVGLVNRVFDSRDAMIGAAIESLELAATRSPLAVAICKRVMGAQAGLNTREGLLVERAGFREVFASADKVEGVGAFLEKRVPVF